MNNQPLPLESQFEVKRLELYLETNPELAKELAISHFKDYLFVVSKYKELEQQQKSVSLPPIPSPGHQRLQTEYDDLQQQYRKLLVDNHHLRHQVQELIELACALSDETAPLPSFLRDVFNV